MKNRMADDNHLLTTADLAERWIMSEGTLENWRQRGLGPTFVKLEGTVRYRLSDVQAYENKNRIKLGMAQCRALAQDALPSKKRKAMK